MGERFLLEIPAEAQYVGAARIFVGAVARQHGLDEDAVEDLKLVVSEACGAAVRADADGDGHRDGIRLVLERTADGVALDVVGGPGPGAGPVATDTTPESFARSVGYDVIRSVYPEAVIQRASDDRGIVRVNIPSGGEEPTQDTST